MTYVPATHGGFIGAVSNSALTMSENNGFAFFPVPPASNKANTLGSSAMDRTLTTENGMLSQEERVIYEDMSGASSGSSRSVEERLITALTRVPPEDISATSTASSCTAASEPSPDVNNAPFDGAFQQIGNMVLSSSAEQFELTPEEDWDLKHEAVQAFVREQMVDDSSTTMTENLYMDPSVLMGGADNSANMTVEGAPAVPLAGPAQPTVTMDADSSINTDALPPVNGEYLVGGAQANGHMGASSGANNCFAQDATLDGYGQPSQQTGASSSADNTVAPNATFGGFNQPQMQMGIGNSATNFNFVATQATPSGYMQPQMPMSAGSSTNINFAAQQQFFVASNATFNGGQQQMALNGGFQLFDPQVNATPQAYFYPVAANTTPYNGVIGQYPLPPAQQAGSAPGNWVNQQQQQQQALNGNVPQHMGQGWPAAAPQPAAPIAVASIRRHQRDAGAPRKRRHAGPATAVAAPVVLASAVQTPAVPAATLAPAQQQVPAQEGPYTLTAAGVPNRFSDRKGNAQGQIPGWSQALKHHNGRCDRLKLDGCVPDCELRARWPQTWADWNSRRFQIRWETERPGRPQEQLVSGFAVAAQGKFEERFVVLGEIQADGSMGKVEKMLRVDKAAVVD
jgi:hypothetical protein